MMRQRQCCNVKRLLVTLAVCASAALTVALPATAAEDFQVILTQPMSGAQFAAARSGADIPFEAQATRPFDCSQQEPGGGGLEYTMVTIEGPMVDGVSPAFEDSLTVVGLAIAGTFHVPLTGTYRLQAHFLDYECTASSYPLTYVTVYEAAACSNGVDDDADGRTDFPVDKGCSDEKDVDEHAPPPMASAAPALASATVPALVRFDASASSATARPVIVAYDWDFDGDASWDASTTVPIVAHVYTAAGKVTPRVRVRDEDGGISTAVPMSEIELRQLRMLALGDSVAAGHGLDGPGKNFPCRQAPARNYSGQANLLLREAKFPLAPEIVLLACSGANTENNRDKVTDLDVQVRNGNAISNGGQKLARRDDEAREIVTVTGGANDVFWGFRGALAGLSALPVAGSSIGTLQLRNARELLLQIAKSMPGQLGQPLAAQIRKIPTSYSVQDLLVAAILRATFRPTPSKPKLAAIDLLSFEDRLVRSENSLAASLRTLAARAKDRKPGRLILVTGYYGQATNRPAGRADIDCTRAIHVLLNDLDTRRIKSPVHRAVVGLLLRWARRQVRGRSIRCPKPLANKVLGRLAGAMNRHIIRAVRRAQADPAKPTGVDIRYIDVHDALVLTPADVQIDLQTPTGFYDNARCLEHAFEEGRDFSSVAMEDLYCAGLAHPTELGQRRLAERLVPQVRDWFGDRVAALKADPLVR